MQISWAPPVHFSPSPVFFSSVAVSDAKHWPTQALPFQLLPGRVVVALSDAAATHKMVCKSLLPPRVLSVWPKCTQCAQKAWGFLFVENPFIYATKNLQKNYLKFSCLPEEGWNFTSPFAQCCTMNTEWIWRVTGSEMLTQQPRVSLVPSIMSSTRGHFSDCEGNRWKIVFIQHKPLFCWIWEYSGGNKEV